MRKGDSRKSACPVHSNVARFVLGQSPPGSLIESQMSWDELLEGFRAWATGHQRSKWQNEKDQACPKGGQFSPSSAQLRTFLLERNYPGVETSPWLEPFLERWEPWWQPEPVRPQELIPAEHGFVPLGLVPGQVAKAIPAKSVRSRKMPGSPKAELQNEQARWVMKNIV